MKQRVANYTVVIEKEKRTGTDTTCYTAFVPLLGIATEADTIEQVEKDIKSLIQFHIDCLAQERVIIPIEAENSLVTRTEVELPKSAIIAY